MIVDWLLMITVEIIKFQKENEGRFLEVPHKILNFGFIIHVHSQEGIDDKR